MHAVESGKDLTARLMIAFGGNGPLHATRVARRAQVDRILIPRDPGVGSAVGFLYAPVSFEIVRSRYAMLETLDLDGLNAFFAEMIAEAETVVRAGAPTGDLIRRRQAFMRYQGQGHEIDVALPDRPLTAEDVPALRQRFEAAYSRQFNRAVPGMTIEILNWALVVSSPTHRCRNPHYCCQCFFLKNYWLSPKRSHQPENQSFQVRHPGSKFLRKNVGAAEYLACLAR